MDADYKNYVTKGNITNEKWNFDLSPLMEEFDLLSFCREGLRINDYEDHGAFLVITNQQYAIGYTTNFGTGPHMETFARIEKDMNGGGEITTFQELVQLSTRLSMRAITARIMFEPVFLDNRSRPVYEGYMHFCMATHNGKNRTITQEQYKEFLNFYEEYNQQFIAASHNYRFHVQFSYIGEDGKLKKDVCDSLDSIKSFMEHNLTLEPVEEEPEVIINNARKKSR